MTGKERQNKTNFIVSGRDLAAGFPAFKSVIGI
jgi:hypothetical protein